MIDIVKIVDEVYYAGYFADLTKLEVNGNNAIIAPNATYKLTANHTDAQLFMFATMIDALTEIIELTVSDAQTIKTQLKKSIDDFIHHLDTKMLMRRIETLVSGYIVNKSADNFDTKEIDD